MTVADTWPTHPRAARVRTGDRLRCAKHQSATIMAAVRACRIDA